MLRSTDGLKEYEPKQRIEGSKHNMEMLQSELKPLRHSIGRCFFFNKNVHSPFVLRYYGLLSENDVTHIFMEYCENGDLKDYVNRRKTELSEKEILSIFAQVVVGLSVLHKNGIIHRDVKHCNILLNKNLEVKLADFGISKKMKDDKEDELFVGTMFIRIYIQVIIIICMFIRDSCLLKFL